MPPKEDLQMDPKWSPGTLKRIENQQGAIPQTPIPNVPMPNIAPVTAAVDQNTGLTRTEQALLSPEEQLIAQRGKGILSLV